MKARPLALGGLTLALLVGTVAAFAPAPSSATTDEKPSARGKTLFLAKGCIACHALSVRCDPAFSARPDLQLGPSLTGISAVAATRRPGLTAADYLRESILEPQSFVVPNYASTPSDLGRPQMPKLPITPEETDALVAFLLDPR